MKVKYIFMDVDGTMTRFLTGREFDVSPLTLLENLMMENSGISREDAAKKIQSCGDLNVHCVTEYLSELGVDRSVYFQVVRETIRPHAEICEDTKRFLPFLKEHGYELYTATTNPKFLTDVKMSLGGLADVSGSPYLTGYYPGCAFLDPQGKYAPDYYQRILADGHFDPALCMMIGDEPLKDAIPAMKAGMRYGVTIDREQTQKRYEKDGILYVNSFDELMPLLEKA